MKDKIEQIVVKVESGHLEPNEATSKLFDLFVVVGRSEQLCYYCETQPIDTNTDYCKECINHVMSGGDSIIA